MANFVHADSYIDRITEITVAPFRNKNRNWNFALSNFGTSRFFTCIRVKVSSECAKDFLKSIVRDIQIANNRYKVARSNFLLPCSVVGIQPFIRYLKFVRDQNVVCIDFELASIRRSHVRNRYSTKRTKLNLLDPSIDRRKVKKLSNAKNPLWRELVEPHSFTLSLNHLSKTRNTYFRGTGISIVFSTTTGY